MHRPLRALTLLSVLLLGTLLTSLRAQAAAPLPAVPRGYILDEPDLLSPAAEQALRERLIAHQTRTSCQMAIAIFRSLPENEYLEDYTVRIARAWGLGTKDRDNGLILFLFQEQRRWRVEVGYGLEGTLPDSLADRILRQTLLPAMQAGHYEQGIDSATRALIQATENEYTASPGRQRSLLSRNSMLWLLVGIFLAFVIWVHIGDTVFQRTGRFILWQIFDLLRLIAISSSSGGGGGRGNDNLRGGGGDFGGGGASGRW
jgi:uncharacterized protein